MDCYASSNVNDTAVAIFTSINDTAEAFFAGVNDTAVAIFTSKSPLAYTLPPLPDTPSLKFLYM